MTKSPANLPDGYSRLLSEVKERVRSAQYAALKAVNKELVGLYWDIGRMVGERQQAEGWGKSVVKRLASDLQAEFPGVSGFSPSNLWRMKLFHETYAGIPKLAPLVREIAWSHNINIMERCKDPLEREFYIRMTRKFGWSKNVLIHQIENQSYEKSLTRQTNFDQALTPELRAQAKLVVPPPVEGAGSHRTQNRQVYTRIRR
jgi:predicted nuclease of restriction endonuclease-like (RecB) superfamily